MKIATYNILKGGSQRVHWVKLIEDHSVDLLLVQESYIHGEHLPPHRYPDADRHCVWQMAEKNRWGSAVFSNRGSLRPLSVSGFTGWVVGAEITGARWPSRTRDSMLVFSVHAPSRGETYAKQVNKLLDEIARIAVRGKLIIGGDFNLTISTGEATARPVRKRNVEIQERLCQEFGLMNCWQESNPGEQLHQTLRWTGNRTIPYHCDGLFVPSAWKGHLESCVVLAGDEWNRLSDHNPVVAYFR